MGPKHQSTLQSFFGGGGTKSTAKALPAKSNSKGSITPNNKKKDEASSGKKRALLDVEEDADTTTTANSTPPMSAKEQLEKPKRRRRVIKDDDEDDEDHDDDEAKSVNILEEDYTPDEIDSPKVEVQGTKKEDLFKKTKMTTQTSKKAGDTRKKDEDTSKKEEDTKKGSGKEDASEKESFQEGNNSKEMPKQMPKQVTKDIKSSEYEACSPKRSTAVNSFFKPKSPTRKPKAIPQKEADAASSAEAKENNNSDNLCTSTILPPPSAIFKALPKGSSIASDKTVLEMINSEEWPVTATSMPYLVLCQVFGQIEEITGRLQIQEILTNLIRQLLLRSSNRTDLYTLMYLASNEVAPAYQCVELGIGDSLLIKAIGEATGTAPNMVKAKYETVGDLGSVAMSFKSKQKTLGGFFAPTSSQKTKATGLSAKTVLDVFREIANTKGSQAQKWKVDKIKKLLVQCTNGIETKYIIRGLQGKLRIGLAQSTVLIALAHALALTHVVPAVSSDKNKSKCDDVEEEDEEESIAKLPSEAKQYKDRSLSIEKRLEGAVNIIKKAYSEVPSYDALLEAVLSVPLELLHEKCTLKPGIPVAPMLAKPTKSIQEVLKRLNGLLFTCEYKYDGERAQVHLLPDGTAKVFSRNLLDTSEKFPEVPQFVREACRDNSKLQSFVMDAEVVAFNQKTGQLVPFQILSTRKKTQESNETAKVQVIVQAFDLMYLNGESLLTKTLTERRRLLHEHFQAVEGKFQFAKFLDHEENGDTTVLEEFLEQAVKGQCEGLMVKTLDVNAVYEPSRRSLNWLKLKKDYLEGLGDSFDLVPIGAFHGKGKRTGFYGAYLLACYDADTEEYQSVCKIGTGFSDEDLASLAKTLNEHIIPQKSTQYNVSDQLECDVWFDAVHVWEVKAADLSKSSAHRGAIGKTNDRGIGLRFPRFERIREDKKPVEATTSDQILEMYYNQDSVAGGGGGGGGGGGDGDDDDDGI